MSFYDIDEIIVIGSGNWGLALATLFAKKIRTRVWTIDEATAKHINKNRQKPGHFFNFPVPHKIIIEKKYTSLIDERKTLIIMAVPSGQVESVAVELAGLVKKPLILSVSKGFDAHSQATLTELIKRNIPDATVLVLSGPTIAEDVAQNKPTRAVLACDNLMCLAIVKTALKNEVIAFEVSRNPSHHEICAALKGLVAIAIGITDKLDLGVNAQGIIMVQGMKETGRILSFLGIPRDMAYGISGAADLIATCIAPNSRNRRLGWYLAEGLTLQQAVKKVGMTVEGVAMAQTIRTLWSLNLAIPLIQTVNDILEGKYKDIKREMIKIITASD